MESKLRNTAIAAGALAAATFAPAAPASAGDLNLAAAAAVIAAFAVAAHDSTPAPRAYAAPPRWNGVHARAQAGPGRAHGWAPRGPAHGRPSALHGRAPHGYAAPAPRWQPRCMERNDIRRMLARQGWSGFGVDKIAGDIAVVYSSREGVRYRIKLNRCTGQLIRVSETGLF